MSTLLLLFLILLISIILILFLFINFAWSAKKALLTEEIAWSAKALKIRRKKNTKEISDKGSRRKARFLEEIAEQSSEFLKDQ